MAFDVKRATAEIDARIESHRRRLASCDRWRPLDEHVSRPVPFVPLADGGPTPFEAVRVGRGQLWVKRDDLTSSLYGGNKVRKLEYILPTAGDRPVVIMGGDASHHVVAGALYGRLTGVPVVAVTMPQPPTPGRHEVALLAAALDVPMFEASGRTDYPLVVGRAMWALRRRRPNLLYPGGSSPAGCLGYVNCGLEIAADVHAGAATEPDVIYTALGTGGTAVGLAAGLALGGLDTQVRAVQVADPLVNNRAALAVMRWRLASLLGSLGVEPPRRPVHLTVVDGYLGRGYGHPTPRGEAATARAEGTGLTLDPTYTAKALAAALDHLHRRPHETVAFLDTMSSTQALTLRE